MHKFITPKGTFTDRIGYAAKDHFGRSHAEIRYYIGKKQIKRRLWVNSVAELIAEIERQKGNSDLAALTWAEAVERWIKEKPASLSHQTDVRRTITRLAERLPHRPLHETTLAEFTTWLDQETQEHGSRTAQLAYTYALAIARWCRKKGLIPIRELPFQYAPKPQHRPGKREPFQLEQLPVYASRLNATGRNFFFFLVLSGIRVTEACRLNDDQIDEKKRTATFVQKGNRPRTLPLSDTLWTIVEHARKLRADLKSTYRNIFVNSHGRPWNAVSFRRYCSRLWKDLPHKVTHELRHTFGTAAGLEHSPDAIKAAMGHASRATSEIYVNPEQDVAAQVQAKTGALLLPYFGAVEPQIFGKPAKDDDEITCPRCGAKFSKTHEKSRKP